MANALPSDGAAIGVRSLAAGAGGKRSPAPEPRKLDGGGNNRRGGEVAAPAPPMLPGGDASGDAAAGDGDCGRRVSRVGTDGIGRAGNPPPLVGDVDNGAGGNGAAGGATGLGSDAMGRSDGNPNCVCRITPAEDTRDAWVVSARDASPRNADRLPKRSTADGAPIGCNLAAMSGRTGSTARAVRIGRQMAKQPIIKTVRTMG